MTSKPRRAAPLPTYTSKRAGLHEPCPHAITFENWCDGLMAFFGRDPTPAMLVRAKNELQDKYHEMRSIVGREHRDRTARSGHRCIWHVYEETYRELRTYELRYLHGTAIEVEEKPDDRFSLGDVIDGDTDDDLAEPAAN